MPSLLPEAKLTLRLPADLHTLLYEQALQDHRSLNNQIVFLLWFALRHYRPPLPAASGSGGSTAPV